MYLGVHIHVFKNTLKKHFSHLKNVRKRFHSFNMYKCALLLFPPYVAMRVCHGLCVSVHFHSHGCNVNCVAGHSYICAAASSPVGKQ